jgi:hypothetical protein
VERLHLEGVVIGLGVLLAGALFFGLVLLGTEISRLRQQQVDGVRLRDLVEQSGVAEEILTACDRLMQRLEEDHERLVGVAVRIEHLTKTREEDEQEDRV